MASADNSVDELVDMLGRTQDIDAELFGGGCDEGATVRVLAFEVFHLSIRKAGLPIDVHAGRPSAFNLQSVEECCKSIAGGLVTTCPRRASVGEQDQPGDK